MSATKRIFLFLLNTRTLANTKIFILFFFTVLLWLVPTAMFFQEMSHCGQAFTWKACTH